MTICSLWTRSFYLQISHHEGEREGWYTELCYYSKYTLASSPGPSPLPSGEGPGDEARYTCAWSGREIIPTNGAMLNDERDVCYPRYTYLVMSHTSTGLIFTLSFLGSGFGLRLSNGGGSMLGYLPERKKTK